MSNQQYKSIQQSLTIAGILFFIVGLICYALTNFTAGGCWGNGKDTFTVTYVNPSNLSVIRGCVKIEINGKEYEQDSFQESGLYDAPSSLFSKTNWTIEGTLKETGESFSAQGTTRYNVTYIVLTLFWTIGLPLGLSLLLAKIIVRLKKPLETIPPSSSK